MWKHSLTTLFCAMALAACDGHDATQASTPQGASVATEQLANNLASLKVCTEAKLPPFEFYDEKGQMVGFDVELMQAIAKNQNMHAEFIHHPWMGLLERVNTDECDIVAHLLGASPEREQLYQFSDSYIDAPDVVIVNQDSALQQFSDLQGKTISVLKASSGKNFLENSKLTDLKLVEKDSLFLALHSLSPTEKRPSDAVVGDKLILKNMIAQSGEGNKFRFIDLPAGEFNTGAVFIMRKGNTDLADKINAGLHAVKTNGEYDKIYQKWFGH